MRTPLSPPHHPAPSPPATPPHRPRLWPGLEPARRHQLARCLAELIRRLHGAARTAATEETSHEPR
jgi:hypothetical protein